MWTQTLTSKQSVDVDKTRNHPQTHRWRQVLCSCGLNCNYKNSSFSSNLDLDLDDVIPKVEHL